MPHGDYRLEISRVLSLISLPLFCIILCKLTASLANGLGNGATWALPAGVFSKIPYFHGQFQRFFPKGGRRRPWATKWKDVICRFEHLI
jgi:hypothetical protein